MPLQRLQKVLARAGLGSRRSCEELIRQGRVRVDGQVATLGCRVDPRTAKISVDDKPLSVAEPKRYIALHKPPGVLSVMEDDRGRPALGGLVPLPERLYPVGRLDVDSEGLVLLTNDGELAHRLTHPRYSHPKAYLVLVEGRPDDEALTRLQRGVMVKGRRTRAAQVQRLSQPPAGIPERGVATSQPTTWLQITLREGRKRQIRHMCGAVGHPVLRLVRIAIGPLKLGALPPGQWRELTGQEVRDLRRLMRAEKAGGEKRERREMKEGTK
ncbi:MAG: pseudouridine synthase [Anaerolineae bacterium]|nr:pseudouridine synthase [Anaerolineae bacterium]